jgi:hypothetical protein
MKYVRKTLLGYGGAKRGFSLEAFAYPDHERAASSTKLTRDFFRDTMDRLIRFGNSLAIYDIRGSGSLGLCTGVSITGRNLWVTVSLAPDQLR